MTNDEIFNTTRGTELWQYYFEEINTLLNLARTDERDKVFKELRANANEVKLTKNEETQ